MSTPDTAPSFSLLMFERAPDPRWITFTATRPLAEMRWGLLRLVERVERAAGVESSGTVTNVRLEGFDEPGATPAVPAPAVAGPGGLLMWSSMAAPLGRIVTATARETAVFFVDGRPAGVFLPEDAGVPDGDLVDTDLGGRRVDVDGVWLDTPWELVATSSERLASDLLELVDGEDGGMHRPLPDTPGVHVDGRHPVLTGRDVRVGPGVVLDTRDGPILLDRNVHVEGPARLVGPLHLGPATVVFGGTVSRSSIGPVCKIRGEISESVLLGYSNKAHDGHLGHALLGRWVNLGAGTTNSDLRNDYGHVRIGMEAGDGNRIDTGLTKVGAFLGDHVKTGIGTLLTTGAVIGAGSQVAGGGLAPSPLPPFSWATPERTVPYRWSRFEATARTVMARRDHTLTPGVSSILRRLHGRTHPSDEPGNSGS